MNGRDYWLAGAVAAGAVVPVPDEVALDHDSFPFRAAHIATEPLTVKDEWGRERRLRAGDLLSASEARALGVGGLDAAVGRGSVARVPSDTGAIGLLLRTVGR
jgi:hypothetical protein